MARIAVTDFSQPDGWGQTVNARERAVAYCRQLEAGGVLHFDKFPFDFPDADQQLMLGKKQSDFKGHKNVSYRPANDVLRGAAGGGDEALHGAMRRFSNTVTDFLGRFLTPYLGKWQTDYASFRPVQEQGRDLSLHKRNDLAHVDAFPSRPTNGGRILRIFVNINPQAPRVWEVTDPFAVIAPKFAQAAGLSRYAQAARSPLRPFLRGVAPVLRTVGIKNVDRSPYDQFMLHFHDFLKENGEYQQNYPKQRLEFSPGSAWMVYTDTLPHAVLSGQFALEQTYIMPMSAMLQPESSPLRVLESLCGVGLSNG